jgi:DNA topoisomerase I
VKHGKINAILPKDREPEQVTMEEAAALIAAKSAKGPAKKPAKKSTKSTRKGGKSGKSKEAVEGTAS